MKKVTFFIMSLIFLISCENGLIGLGERIDIDIPQVTIGKYADGSTITNADYVRGIITLSGSVTDDIGVSAVNFTIVDATTLDTVTGSAEIDYTAMTWSYVVDTTSFVDGEKNITIEVLDTSSTPKSDSLERMLFFDNTAPLVLISEPSDYEPAGGLTNSIVTLKGEIEDEFKLDSIEISLLSGTGTVDAIDASDVNSGTWTSALRSTGTGDYEISVIATDKAGNISSGFYHKKDVYAANDGDFITTKDIYDIREGNLVQPSGLTQADLVDPSILLDILPLTIDLAGDEPQISISNPDPLASVVENTMPGTSKAIGYITEDDGINVSSIQISIDAGALIPVSSTSGSGLYVQWEHDLSSLGSGDHTLQLYAEDDFGVFSYSSIVPFRINLGAPIVSIESPEIGSYINTNIYTVSGSANDGEGITHVQISLDNGTSWTLIPITPSTDVSWSYTSGAVTDGLQTVKIRASDDNGGSWSYSNMQFTVDTSDPSTSFSYPAKGSYINGEVIIRGANSDNSSIIKTEIKVGDSRSWVELTDDIYNWEYSINSLEYENATDSTETPADSGIYKLNVYSRVTDIAGNISESSLGDFFFYIDNALDRPTVNIITPSNNSNLGGSVLVSGTSYDDDGEVYQVFMQIDVNSAPGSEPDFSDTTVDLGVDGIDFDGPGGNAPVTIIDETAWYPIYGKSPWSVELNTEGELYDTDGAGSHVGDIHIRVRAEDKDGGALSIAGEYKELHIRLDDTIPYIENITPLTNSYEKDIFTLTGDVIDETQIKHLEISYNGGANYHYIIKNNTIQAPFGTGTVIDNYSINTVIDTSDIPDVGAVNSGDITLRLKVTDSTNYQSLYSLHYYIDNVEPSSDMAQDITNIQGSEAVLYGEANDLGSVSGVNRIAVYFEKDGNFYNPRNGSATAVTTADIDGINITYPTDSSYLVIIDSIAETIGGSDVDGDGINEQLHIGNPSDWMFEIDSNLIPDGDFKIHFVVFDNSENAVYNSRNGVIRNNPPVIESITLRTDLNGDGDSSDSGEQTIYSPSEYTSTDFTARNDLLEIAITLVGATGNDPLSYSVTYDGGANLATGPLASIDISNAGTYPDVSLNGAEFICTITDTAGLSTTESIFLNIDNIDNIRPTVKFGELDADTSVPDDAGEKEGHIEERSWTNYNNGSGSDPDVSGKIIFNGSAWDNQRIQDLEIWIDLNNDGDFNDLNEKVLIADEDTDGTLKSIGSASITLETLTEISGHNVNFTFVWDSASLFNDSGNDIDIQLVARDYNPNSNTQTSYPDVDYNLMTVDVVPYISSIENISGFGISNSVLRSSTGKYSIDKDTSVSNLLTVKGFNLGSGSPSVFISTSTAAPTAGEDISANVQSGGTNTTFSLIKDILYSGYLTVSVNSVYSLNNSNNNSSSVNQEQNPGIPISEQWTDDRYFYIWDTTQVLPAVSDETFNYPDMIMSGNQPIFSYSDDNSGFTRRTTGNTTSIPLGGRWYERQTSIERDDDGNFWTLSAQDAFSNGNIGFLYLNRDRNATAPVGASGGNFIELIGEDYISRQLNRFRYPKLLISGPETGSQAFIAYYDFHSSVKGLVVSAFDVSGSTTSTFNEPGIDSAYSSDLVSVPGTASGNSSQYFDIEYAGSVFTIAYYDEASASLILQFNDSGVDGNGKLNDSSATGWDSIIIENGTFAGSHVSTTSDAANIYLSYYDIGNANLKLAIVPRTMLSQTTPSGSESTYTIDSYLSVGTWSQVGINNGLPVISYYAESYGGTKSSIRYASPKTNLASITDGVLSGSNKYSGFWEIVTVPAASVPVGGMPQFNHTQLGFYTDTAVDLPVVGWLGNKLEYSKLQREK